MRGLRQGNLAWSVLGEVNSCRVTDNGNVLCWGAGAAISREGKSVPVSPGWGHTCGLTEDRDVVCWGYDSYPAPKPISLRARRVGPRLWRRRLW